MRILVQNLIAHARSNLCIIIKIISRSILCQKHQYLYSHALGKPPRCVNHVLGVFPWFLKSHKGPTCFDDSLATCSQLRRRSLAWIFALFRIKSSRTLAFIWQIFVKSFKWNPSWPVFLVFSESR